MYAVVNHLHLSIPVDELTLSVEQDGASLVSQLPGFRDFYFVRVTENHAIVVLIWESASDAENGAKTFGPTWFAKHIAPHLASEQQRSVGEVVAHARK